MKNSTSINRLYYAIGIIFLIVLWKVLSFTVRQDILLPSPEYTFNEVLRIMKDKNFLYAVVNTAYRSITGFGIAFLGALILAVLSKLWSPLGYLLNPLVLLTKAVPTMSIILLALIWLNTDTAPVLIGFMVIFPILYTNIVEGLDNVDKKLIQMSELFDIGKLRMIRDLFIPSVIPYILSASSTALGLNVKVIIAAEVISQPKYAIGTAMQLEKVYLNTAGVFAWTIVAVLLSALFDLIIYVIKIGLERWKK